MLNDTDDWPVPCPECGHVSHENIGRLKQAINVTCERCLRSFEFHKEEFVQVLDNLKRTVGVIGRNSRFTGKKY